MTKEDIKYLKSLGINPNDVIDYAQEGSQVNNELTEEKLLQIIQIYANKNKLNPDDIIKKLQSLSEEDQSMLFNEMYQDVIKNNKIIAKNGGLQNIYKSKIKSNVEAEDDEHVLTPNGASFELKGNTHAEGGIDLNLPGKSMIFSEHMKAPKEIISKILNKDIKDLSKKEKKYSFADLAELYSTEKDYSDIEKNKDAFTKKAIQLNIVKKLPKLYETFENQERYKFGLGIENDYKNLINPIENQENNNKLIAQKGKYVPEWYSNYDAQRLSNYLNTFKGNKVDFFNWIDRGFPQLSKYYLDNNFRDNKNYDNFNIDDLKYEFANYENKNEKQNTYGKSNGLEIKPVVKSKILPSSYQNNSITNKNNNKNNNKNTNNNSFWYNIPQGSLRPYDKLPFNYGNNQTKEQYIDSWKDLSKQTDLKKLREYQVFNFGEGIQDFYTRGMIPYENYGETLGREKGYQSIYDALQKNPNFGAEQYVNNLWGNRGPNYKQLPLADLEEGVKNSIYKKYKNSKGEYYISLQGKPIIYEALPDNEPLKLPNNEIIKLPIESVAPEKLPIESKENTSVTEKKITNPINIKELDPVKLDYSGIRNANYANGIDQLLSNITKIKRPILYRRPPLQSLNKALDLPEITNIQMNKGLSNNQSQTNNSGLSSVVANALNNNAYIKSTENYMNSIPQITEYYNNFNNGNNNINYNNANKQWEYDLKMLPEYYLQNDNVDKGIYQNTKDNYRLIANMRNNEAKIKESINNLLLEYDGKLDKNGNILIDKNKSFMQKNEIKSKLINLALEKDITPEMKSYISSIISTL